MASSTVVPRRTYFPTPITATIWVWPPEARNRQYGKARAHVSRGVSAWASRWFTAISGVLCTIAIAFAVVSPTITPPIRPGPAAAATPESWAKPTPASFIALSTIPSSRSTWARAAISGTTPPKRACSSVCDRTILDRIRPAPSLLRSTTAAAVSSQVVSIPSTNIGVSLPNLSSCAFEQTGVSLNPVALRGRKVQSSVAGEYRAFRV